jgi:hypothetical protein
MGLLLTFFFCVFTGAVAVVAQNATANLLLLITVYSSQTPLDLMVK